MQKLFSTDYNSSEHTVKKMHTVLADCYIDIRGKLDFHGREAKADATPACNTTGNAGALCTQDFFNSYKHQLNSAVRLFHENSGNFHDVALCMLYVAKELDFRGSDILKLCKMGRRLIEAANSASRGEWRYKTLGNYGLYSYHAFWCLEKRGNMGLALFYLHESMTVTDLAAISTGNERLKDHYASNALFGRLRLIEELTMIGRVEEAAEIRAGVIASPFLRKAMENEVGEQF
ncbi:Transposase [Colletotrichum higginsianum IMI 349063]|nr:Transposase [Colletotrichum higginsianum IMI 349063]OBR08077.1 Transposase [Colletotrichum higginsianum IMI 349063]